METILCLIRLIVCIPMIVIIGITSVLVKLLGVKINDQEVIRVFERFVFNQ